MSVLLAHVFVQPQHAFVLPQHAFVLPQHARRPEALAHGDFQKIPLYLIYSCRQNFSC